MREVSNDTDGGSSVAFKSTQKNSKTAVKSTGKVI